MAHVITFDTLSFAKKLQAAGCAPLLAEAHAQAQADLLSSLADDQLATKKDLMHLEQKMDTRMKSLEGKFDSLENRFNVLETKVGSLENKIIIKLSCVIVAAVGVIATLMTIFHSM